MSADEPQTAPIYHRRVGDILVTTVCDGYIDVPPEALANPTGIPTGELLRAGFQRPQPRITVNAFLVRVGDRTALVETGSGATLGPTLGWLPANLARAGVDPASIDTVLLTHMHPDHSNGLLDGEGRPFFPNAELRIHEREVAHWHDDAAMARGTERQRYYFQTARDQLKPCRSQLSTFAGETEVFPGVTTVPIPGHTPGHTAYRIASGSEQVLIWGDIVHVPEVQIPFPDVGMAFDTDGAAAVATRKRVLDMVAADRVTVGGMHLGFPGFAHVTRSDAGFALVPEVWQLVH
jgi:glyoxylase-like metal-dependent hydrolase (beta-lactamase superfamily II)